MVARVCVWVVGGVRVCAWGGLRACMCVCVCVCGGGGGCAVCCVCVSCLRACVCAWGGSVLCACFLLFPQFSS